MNPLVRRVQDLRGRHALGEYRLVRRVARRFGYQVVRADCYSPIPDVEWLPTAIWEEPAPMPGIDWDLDRQLAFLRETLGEYVHELSAPAEPPGTVEGYYYRNEFFNAFDADVLHALVRALRPRRLVEIGSGYSTLVIAGAGARNRAEGAPLRHSVYDPFPSPALARVGDRVELHATPAEQIPPERLRELDDGDVLFIDSTHAVRPGGEVVRLVLEALPRLAAGVIVHLHDFFRPFEYPRILLERFGCYWQEHHLVQALLSGSHEFEILCATHALMRQRPVEVRALAPALEADMLPSSLWLRRRV